MSAFARLGAVVLVAVYLAGSGYTAGRVWHRIDCPVNDPYGECGERRLWVSIIIAGLWPFTISAVREWHKP